MDRQTAEQKAIEILKQVVDALAEKRYEDIPKLVELEEHIQEPLEEFVAEVYQMWGWEEIPPIDPWTEERVAIPTNPCYQQLNFFHFNNGSGFAVDYELARGGELSDMTLQMEFFYEGEGLRPVFLDLHVL